MNPIIRYDNEELSINWTYKIVRHSHQAELVGRTIYATQNFITLNKIFLKLAKVGRVLFLYKNPENGKFHISTSEPPFDTTYEVMNIRRSNKQRSIQLPANFLKLGEQQTATLSIYPQEHDYYDDRVPKITIDIGKRKKDTNSTAEIIKMDDGYIMLKWTIDADDPRPEDVMMFLTKDQQELISNGAWIVELDPITLDVELYDTLNMSAE